MSIGPSGTATQVTGCSCHIIFSREICIFCSIKPLSATEAAEAFQITVEFFATFPLLSFVLSPMTSKHKQPSNDQHRPCGSRLWELQRKLIESQKPHPPLPPQDDESNVAEDACSEDLTDMGGEEDGASEVDHALGTQFKELHERIRYCISILLRLEAYPDKSDQCC